MKNLSKSNPCIRKSMFFFGFLIFARCFISVGSNTCFTSAEKLNHYFSPDTVPPDTSIIIDTVNVEAIYTVADTAEIYTDGLDDIILLIEDSVHYAEPDSSIIFAVGDIDSNILFSKPDDTAAYYYATDNAAYYIPQNDSAVYTLISVDSNLTGNKQELLSLRIGDNAGMITINPGHTTKELNAGLFGIHIPGIFKPNHISEDDTYYMQAWQALSDLKPSSLRYPGGADTRWQHPLDYDKDWDGITDPIKGYGYNIDEIIRFYDVTNETDQVPAIPTDNIQANVQDFIDAIHNDLEGTDGSLPNVCDLCHTWMDADAYQEDFEKIYSKWKTQETLPAGEKYIDQFLRMVKKIEEENQIADPGYKVEIIVDLPIPMASATECWNFVDYLRNNPIHNLNVAGVEMGNETYFGWAMDMMGFETFDDYYNYIDGKDPDPTWTENFYDYVYGPPPGEYIITEAIMAGKTKWDHNYFKEFKLKHALSCKIGLPAENLPEEYDATDGNIFGVNGPDPGEGTFPFAKHVEGWNADLGSHYGDKFLTHANIYKFDAVIPHTYYKPHNNWYHIATDHLCALYPTEGAASCNSISCSDPLDLDYTYDGNWKYDEYDPRIKDAFQGMMGYPIWNYPADLPPYFGPAPGNLNEFLKTRYMLFYQAIDDDLQFSLAGPDGKEMWATEKNFLSNDTWNEDPAVGDETFDKRVLDVYYNTFVQGYFLQEWFLRDLTKLNFTKTLYRQNFFTYSHIHSFAGGGWQDLLVQADDCDLVANGLNPALINDPYWMRRTTYWTYFLLSDIFKQKLNYLPSVISLPEHSRNQPPTVFIDDEHENLYVYFSNTKGLSQNNIIDPENLFPLFDYGFKFTTIDLHMVDAEFPHSASGRNLMVSKQGENVAINSCYECNQAYADYNPHPFDIQGITIVEDVNQCDCELPLGAVCVPVPGYSYGYFKIGIHAFGPYERQQATISDKYNVVIYPNPAYDYFSINLENNYEMQTDENIDIIVSDLAGFPIATFQISESNQINISNLNAGLYQVTFRFSDNSTITKPLIKIK